MLASTIAALAGTLGVAGCNDGSPIRVGFLGGLTGRDAEAVKDGRSGAMLAVEQHNQNGGVNGRMLELLIQDDGHGPDTGKAAIGALIAAKPVAIVGPFISAVAAAVLPQANAARMLMLSPTATASELAGKDDYLVRMNSTAGDAACAYAGLLYQRGQRRVALAVGIDEANTTYAESWRAEFYKAFQALGGRVVAQAGFASETSTSFMEVVRSMLIGRPDGLLFIGTAVDVARLAQQANRLAPGLPMTAADSAAGGALLEQGGHAVEGMLVGELFNRGDISPRYLQFRDSYEARFGQLPGYHGVSSYDAVTVLKEALARRSSGESPRDAVLRHGPYEGLQQPIAFDKDGDVQRSIHFAVVRNGLLESTS